MTSASVTASLRIGDAEREAAITALTRHYAEGRLTNLEHDERTGSALQARTRADLDKLFADLPRFDLARQQHAATGQRVQVTRAVGSVARIAMFALFVVGAIFVVLHLLPIIALAALVIVVTRVAFGRRHVWYGRRW
jgi:hypothetical protein